MQSSAAATAELEMTKKLLCLHAFNPFWVLSFTRPISRADRSCTMLRGNHIGVNRALINLRAWQ